MKFKQSQQTDSLHGELETSLQESKKPSRRFEWKVLAICLTLAIVIGSTAFAIAAEAKEYNQAIAFFEENGLSANELNRSDVKAVYRDITEKKFSYDKTAEVLQKTVSGWEIRQREPTPEELATLWYETVWMNTIAQNGISYHIYNRDENNSEASTTGILECYQNGEKLWSTEFKNNCIHGCTYTKEAVLCWGKAEAAKHDWIALVDKDGKMKWQHQLDHGSEREWIATVLTNENNTWTVISKVDFKSICLSYYGADGKELSSHKAEIGKGYGIRNAAKLGDGYIIQLWNPLSKETAVLCKMDLEGNLSDVFSYTEDDCYYYITDMIEFEGRIYLSAYTVPAREEVVGKRREMAKIQDYMLANSDRIFEISSEELTPIVRDNYTAMLLVCDPEEGTPNTFYAVEGSWGGRLSLNTSGQLEWTVESITSASFFPLASSFTINGNCAVFRYTFSAGGVFAGYTDTGDVVYYQK